MDVGRPFFLGYTGAHAFAAGLGHKRARACEELRWRAAQGLPDPEALEARAIEDCREALASWRAIADPAEKEDQFRGLPHSCRRSLRAACAGAATSAGRPADDPARPEDCAWMLQRR